MTHSVYTVRQAADELRFPPGRAGRERVLRLIRSKRLAARRVGREYLITARELGRLLGDDEDA
jgi:excisionase family DNA binding protein